MTTDPRWTLEDVDPEVDEPDDHPAGGHEGADVEDPPDLPPEDDQ